MASARGSTPRVAVVGCGYWGKNLVRNFARLGVLAAISDSDVDAAGRIAADHDVRVEAFVDVLKDESLDAVAIATPAATHADLAREALLSGKDVFVEKPLSLDVKSGEDLCELAVEQDRVLMVGHLLRYHPAFTALSDLVSQGVLGRIRYAYSNRLNLGKFRREENILWSFAPHDISMIISLIGEEPDSVSAVGAAYLHNTIADVTTTHLSFPGGERAHVFVSWLHPNKEQKLVVVGDEAMAVFDDAEPWETKLVLYRHKIHWRQNQPEPERADAEPVAVSPAEPLMLECEHFLDCVRSGATPRTDGTEGLAVLRVLDAAERSMHSGTVTIQSQPNVWIHESAIVDDDVAIGAGSRVWHFSHILGGSRIGDQCTVGQNVMIGPDVTIGNRCKIQNNVSIYKGVELDDDVFCGPSCVFTNVSAPRAHVNRKNEFEVTRVGRGASIGANATIVCGHSVGDYALVGAGAVVTADVPPFALVLGVPARRVGWVSHDGERLEDDLVCPRSGRRYELRGPDELVEIRDD